MLFKYKIQKIVDGNGDESFEILVTQVSKHRWYKKKIWKKKEQYDQWLAEVAYNTLGEAQLAVREVIKMDEKQEREDNKSIRKVIKEYSITDIPNHISVEQQEKFCDLKGAKNAV
jgi:ribonuclease D